MYSKQYGERPCYRLVGYDLSEGYRAARFSTKTKRDGPRSHDVYVYPLQLLGLDRTGCEAVIDAAGLPSPGLSSCVFCAAMHPEEIDELHPEELWLIVILEAHAQVNLKKIRGLWGHRERMTEYIIRRRLLPASLVEEVWAKWAAEERPFALRNNPEAIADVVLFGEVRRLAALSSAVASENGSQHANNQMGVPYHGTVEATMYPGGPSPKLSTIGPRTMP